MHCLEVETMPSVVESVEHFIFIFLCKLIVENRFQGWPVSAILHFVGIELRTSRLTAQC
jgi:hypothetical protein